MGSTSIAIIMVTGSVAHATTGRVAELRRQLGVALVAKPFTINQILHAVVEATQRLGSGGAQDERNE
jgi:hypothetical protein